MVVWDGGLSAERVAALPEYKAQRPEMPDDLRPQLDEIVELFEGGGRRFLLPRRGGGG